MTTQFPYPLVYDGKQYNARVLAEANNILGTLMSVLPSVYLSDTPSTNYAQELRVFALELAKIRIMLDDVSQDSGFTLTRSEFLYQILGYLIFVNGKLPKTTFNDKEFKDFLLAVVTIYFQGSIPESIEEGIGLFTSQKVTITENYIKAASGVSGYDISDQFTFDINFEIDGNEIPQNFIDLDYNIKLMLGLIKPAHTLYRVRYIFKDDYDAVTKISDQYRWTMQDYHYDDVRKNWNGLKGVDRLGVKESVGVTNEDVSHQF